MSLALEITPKEYISYDMPDYLDAALKRAFDYRLTKTIRSFVAMLPEDIRAQIKITKKPRQESSIRGHRPNWVFYDELATPEQIKAVLEYEKKRGAKQ